jgi:hypothetical protein
MEKSGLSGRLNPMNRTTDTSLVEDWVRPRAGLNAVEKREIFLPCRESNPGRLTPSPSCEDCEILNDGTSDVESKSKAIPVTGRGGL